jgi:hypothetical protein
LYWWSIDRRADSPDWAWVSNAGGGIGVHRKSETASVSPNGLKENGHLHFFHVRAVRNTGAVLEPPQHFKNNGDGTVTDTYTGLVWQSAISQDTYTWDGALAYANSLNENGGYANYTDWRIPDIKELFSLVEVSRMAPCLDSTVFDVSALYPYKEGKDPQAPGVIWSSTSMHNSRPGVFEAWDLHDLYAGIISYSIKAETEHCILVRGNSQLEQ